MYKFTLTTLALLGVASAANSTTSLWLLGFYFNEQTILGSIIASDATATTYSLSCGDYPDDCGLPTPFIFTQGPSTVQYSYVQAEASGITKAVQLGCAVTSSATGVCSISIDVGAESIMSTATTTSFTNASDLQIAVTITARAAASNSAAITTGSNKSSATSSTGSLASVSHNRGMPMITSAPWVLGAMAAGVAIAAV